MSVINLVIVHGIGVTKDGYSGPLSAGVRREFNRRLQEERKDGRDYADQLNAVEVVWDDILAANQRTLAERLRAGFEGLERRGLFQRALGAVLSPLKKGINFLRTDFAAEYVSDIIGYRNDLAYRLIQGRIAERLQPLAHVDGRTNVSFVAHSLGTVIASDFIYDRVKADGGVHPGLELHNFFTMGSPMALFALRYGAEAFASPIRMQHPGGRWINIFDRDDPIAYPLKPLNAAYAQAVDRDVEVSTGPFGIAHVHYWDNTPAHGTIAEKLAADWLRDNAGGN